MAHSWRTCAQQPPTRRTSPAPHVRPCRSAGGASSGAPCRHQGFLRGMSKRHLLRDNGAQGNPTARQAARTGRNRHAGTNARSPGHRLRCRPPKRVRSTAPTRYHHRDRPTMRTVALPLPESDNQAHALLCFSFMLNTLGLVAAALPSCTNAPSARTNARTNSSVSTHGYA